MSPGACYRYRTPVLVGPWRRWQDRAVEYAIAAKQAEVDGDGALHWAVSGGIEVSSYGPDAPCGEVLPTPDMD